MEAVVAGDEAAVAAILGAGGRADVTDAQGFPAIVLAAKRRHPAIASLLLGAGASPDQPGPSGVTALTVAVMTDDPATAEVLLAGGAAADGLASDAFTPLMWASLGGKARIVELLMAHGADPGRRTALRQTAVELARMNHHPRIVEILEGRKRAPSALGDALRSAAARNDLGALRELLAESEQEDVDAEDTEGMTPLLAAMRVHEQRPSPEAFLAIRLLLDGGADPTRRSEGGGIVQSSVTPATHAAVRGELAVLELFLDHGLDRRAQAEALGAAAVANERGVILALLARGVPVDAPVDEHGNTALMSATLKSLDAATLLLERGASVSARNEAGGTPLSHAMISGDLAIVKLLLASGADPDSTDHLGGTVLIAAVHQARADVVAALLAAGADPDRADGSGGTPLGHALRRRPDPPGSVRAGDPAAVLELLRKAGAKDEGKSPPGGQ